ncbi:MAG: UDP-N-acetylmuramoyl-L-alanyl-D-glutamate--2,6-diaminopimelate ligase [Pseudomonadota bacterium]
MKLGAWLLDEAVPAEQAEMLLEGVAEHHAEVRPGFAFVAATADAATALNHIAQARAAGAVVAVTSAGIETASSGLPVVLIDNVAARRGELARRFYGDPTAAQTVIGVTGTNGKTSVAYHLADLMRVLKGRSGYIGTLGWGDAEALRELHMTTPNATALQRMCADMLSNGIEDVACEISSHALEQGRAAELAVDYAVFTNLSRDHLDYHETMAAYGAAKRRLFTDFALRGAVINIDDEFGAELARDLACPVVTIGQDGDWQVQAQLCGEGMDVEWQSPLGPLAARLPVLAEYAVTNITCALAVMALQGADAGTLTEALRRLRQVPGRMEIVPGAQDFAVIVDFAHTPDALAKALQALRPSVRGRLICLIGCGGDRDAGKRAQMGRIAATHADLVWLTSDNPRSENPAEIIAAMRAGAGDGLVWECEDRAQAIGRAIFTAGSGDVVLLAGKGHEHTQEIGGEFFALDDRLVAAQALLEYSSDDVVGGG